jgi:hypothetical protein
MKERKNNERICRFYLRNIKVEKYRSLDFCALYRDEACCSGIDCSCPFYYLKVGKVTKPTKMEVYGSLFAHKRKGW